MTLMLIAERRGDGGMAETAFSQLNTAYDTMRDGGHVPFVTLYERLLPWGTRYRRAAARAIKYAFLCALL